MLTKSRIKKLLLYLGTLIVVLIFFLPLAWVVISSFKTQAEIFAIPPKWIFQPTFNNYIGVWGTDFSRQMGNSLFVATFSTALSIILGSLAAYGFSRYPFKGGDFVMFWILSLRMLPVIAVIVPFYLIFRTLGLLDTRLALILIYSIFNISFTIWVLKGFFDEIPVEYEEAAMLEGYSRLEIFFRVSLPLALAGLFVIIMFALIQSLNEFLIALALTTRLAETAPVGLAKLQTFLGTDWGRISAAAVIFMTPVVIFTILIRNELIRGMSFGQISE
ncbi:MAG: carbohydrate ABC transporter permease [Anaerolineales bacterium]|nr:carbohydrate ABC transporter permease [Anaerolineales bacterium]